jgi:dephospho-CoA kinase
MKVVGITGGIGSGKTTVCKVFEILGVPVFYADDEAKKLYEEATIKSKVVKLFGKKIVGKKNEIDKKKLAELVFSNSVLLAKLNALIHPQVGKIFRVWKRKQKRAKIVIREAAIMIESKTYKDLDFLITVNSSKEQRVKRILSKGSFGVEDIKQRMSEQLSDKERSKYADAIVVNDENKSLIKQVVKLHKKLVGL